MKDNELITRRNIELALLNKGQHSRRYRLGDIWELNYDEIREVLDGVDADVQPVRWIPVSERLPDVAQRVLLSGHGQVMVGMLHSFGKYSFEPTGISYVYSKDDIEAWMPLPEPWKEGEAE